MALPDLDKITALVAALKDSGVGEASVSGADWSLSIRFVGAGREEPLGPIEVRADKFGHVSMSNEATGTPFVSVADHVAKGDIIALVRIGLLALPIRATTAGRVSRICVNEGDLVEYGDGLIEIEPDRS